MRGELGVALDGLLIDHKEVKAIFRWIICGAYAAEGQAFE